MSVPSNLALVDGGPVDGTGPNTPTASEFTLVGADLDGDAKDEARKKEEAVVDAFWKRFTSNRGYDKVARRQFAIDRRYASGRAQNNWAVSTNIVGSMVDILCAALYVKDPDVSITKAPHVDESNTRDAELFAKTLQIVVSKLWKSARLKKRMNRVVRSILSVGQGWLKAVMVGQKKPDPQIKGEINSLEENMARVKALQAQVGDQADDSGSPLSWEQLAEREEQLKAQLEALATKLEVLVYEGLAIDFVKCDDIQVSTDVAVLEEYLDADTVWHIIYVPKADAKVKFPRLTADDVKAAKCYYRRPQVQPNTSSEGLLDGQENVRTTEDGEEYTSNEGAEKSTPFIRVVEAWDRRDGMIRTGIDGVLGWAIEPYAPPYGCDRFYPFFYFAIYEVDDERMPQSLSQRLAKLQDEYSCTRSNFRISRERSAPGTMFNSTQLSDEEIQKVQNSVREEFIAVKPASNDAPMANLFMAKPVGSIDPRLYDTTPILQDAERMAGVQEAQTAAITVEKTATEAHIQQAGFSARTEAGRGSIEYTMSDLAQYTAECAVQCLTTEVVQRMAGKTAFWPEGMDLADLFTLVDVEIEAGTTGKPKKKTDQAAWGTVLPMIQALQNEIAGLYQASGGNPMILAQAQPVIDAKKELLKQTMMVAGVDNDLERFLPSPPQPLVPEPMLPGVMPAAAGPTDPGGGPPASPSPAADASAAGLAPPPGPVV